MLRLIKDFFLGREWRKDPFDSNDDMANGVFLFIYMTGRGEFSYLFPDTPESDIVAEAHRTIPMGYTQIWIFQWLKTVRPPYEIGKRKKTRSSPKRAVDELGKGTFQEGQSYVLLDEDGQCPGWSNTLQIAESAAQAIADAKKSRIAIGLLRANIAWH